MNHWRVVVLVIVGMSAGLGGLLAAPAFKDTFAAESRGKPTINYKSFSKWIVTRGAVDVIGKGGSVAVADLYPGNGLYVDLDGSDQQAGPGRIETKAPITLQPGDYEFEFDLGGNSDGSEENGMTVSIGNLFRESFKRHNIAPPGRFERIARTIRVAEPTTVKIVFDAEGTPDYFGLVIDNVRLQRAGELPVLPVALAGAGVLALAAVGLLVVRRRRGSRA